MVVWHLILDDGVLSAVWYSLDIAADLQMAEHDVQ